MKVFGNWDDLVEKCEAQDEELKRRRTPDGRSWFNAITDNLGFYGRLERRKKIESVREGGFPSRSADSCHG